MEANARQEYERNKDHARRMSEIALRGTALLWDLQADAARSVLEIQANSAKLFGAPDLTALFPSNGRSTGLFTATVDRTLDSLRQIRETVSEVQWQFARIAEEQTVGIAERFQQSIEQLGQRSQQGLQQLRQLAREEANEFERMAREGNGQRDAASGEQRGESGNQRSDAERSPQRREGRRATA